jgi:hypothetical protein
VSPGGLAKPKHIANMTSHTSSLQHIHSSNHNHHNPAHHSCHLPALVPCSTHPHTLSGVSWALCFMCGAARHNHYYPTHHNLPFISLASSCFTCQVPRRLPRSALDPLMGVVPPPTPVPPDATITRYSGKHSGLVCHQHRKLEVRVMQQQQQPGSSMTWKHQLPGRQL